MLRDYRIKDLRYQAMEKLEESRRIDFMEKLPQEVVTLILDQLDFHDIVNCLQVSKNWRHHICNSPARSRQDMILGYEASQESASLAAEFYKSSVRLLSNEVKCLTIHKNEKITRRAPDMLAGVRFNNLRVLAIGNFKIIL